MDSYFKSNEIETKADLILENYSDNNSRLTKKDVS